MQALELDAGLEAELGVEVGERLVEEEEPRLADDGAGERDALLLAAGELAGAAGEQVVDADLGGGLADAGGDLGLATPSIRSGKPMFCASVMCG